MNFHVFMVGLAIVAASLSAELAEAGGRTNLDTRTFAPIAEASPTLAPFQHVRFCLRYPTDCKSNTGEREKIDANAETMELLRRVNHSVNISIVPRAKSYGRNLEDSWAIAPASGDCNDYAVTKRRELIENGLPPSALRLSATKTASGVGHLVLIVSTTKADIVLDNLSEKIRPWQQTDYQWLKIQSATDPRFWSEVRTSGDQNVSQLGHKVRVAGR
jgi:predicted transglutaminase-like cysteine proteinase